MGFDLEPEHRVSFYHPEKELYVHVGKVCDVSTKEKFNLPRDAFKLQNDSSQLTLMIKESGVGSSATKKPDLTSNEICGHPLSNQDSGKVAESEGIVKTQKFAQQHHALLNSQSFKDIKVKSSIEKMPQIQRAFTGDQSPIDSKEGRA